MRKLRELTTRYSLADLVEVLAERIVDGETCPEAKPEGEREFVKLHKTDKQTDPDVYKNPSFAGKVKKDTSRAGRDPLPGFPPEVKRESLEEAERPSWAEFRKMQGAAGQDPQARHLPVGHQVAGTDQKLEKGGNIWNVWKGLKNKKAEAEKPAESPKAPEFQKTDAAAPVKAQTPDTHGPAGAPQPSQSPKAPQWSPTAKPFNMTPVTPELKAKQIQSPINKEPMNRVPGTTPPPSAMDRVKAVTGRATPAASSASATPSSTQATGQAAPTPSGPSASGSVNLTGAAKVAGAVGQAMTGGGVAVGQAIGKNFPGVGQAISGAAKSLIPGQGVSVGQRLGQKFRNWLGKEEDEGIMNYRAAMLSGLIRGLEPPLDEAAGVAKLVSKKVDPLIKRPKFDARGNLVLTQAAKQNITQGKKSRKLTGQTYKPSEQKRFGEAKEQLDEKNWFHKVGASTPNDEARGTSGKRSTSRTNREKAGPNFRPKSAKERYASNRRRAEMSKKHPELSEGNTPADQGIKAAKRDDEERKKSTVLVSPKGYKGGGKVTRIPKSQYDPKKHSLAEEQLDEKNWIQGAIKKPGALTAAAHRAKQSVGEFAREHKHSSGKVGKRARLALTLKGLNKEETEQIDELEKKTLHSYANKATKEFNRMDTKLEPDSDVTNKNLWKKQGKRLTGLGRARSRLKEEQLDELKKSTLASYAKKSASEIATASSFGSAAKRHYKGLNRAIDRLGGTYEAGKERKFMVPGDESGKTYSQKKKKIYHGEETEIDEGLRPKIKVSGDMSVDKTFKSGKKTYHVSGFKSTKTAEDEAKKGWEKTASKFGKWRGKTFGVKFVHGEETQLDEEADLRRAPRKLAPQEWRIGCMSEFDEKKAVQLIEEGKKLDEVITKSTPVGDVIHDFVHSKNKVFKGDDKKQRIKRALGAYYGKQRGE